MKRITVKTWLVLSFLIIFASLAIAFTILFREVVRDQVVLPLLDAWRFLRRFISSLDSDFLWGVFLLALYAWILLSLPSLNRSSRKTGQYSDKRSRSGRLLHWLHEVRELQNGKYITRFTTLELKKLILNTVAFRQQCSLRQAEKWLANPENQHRIPPEIHKLLEAGYPGQFESTSLWQSMKAWLLGYPRLPKTPVHFNIEPILNFLESQDGKEYRQR